MNWLDAQVIGGLFLFAVTAWQLATGMRWIKFGRMTVKIHRWTGIALLSMAAVHGILGLWLAGWIKF